MRVFLRVKLPGLPDQYLRDRPGLSQKRQLTLDTMGGHSASPAGVMLATVKLRGLWTVDGGSWTVAWVLVLPDMVSFESPATPPSIYLRLVDQARLWQLHWSRVQRRVRASRELVGRENIIWYTWLCTAGCCREMSFFQLAFGNLSALFTALLEK